MAHGDGAGEIPASHQMLESLPVPLVQREPEERRLSTFEQVITTNAPILESLLLQIPTDSIIKLYHSSSYLRTFLRSYPTAWMSLSFRLPLPSGTLPNPSNPGSNLPESVPARQSRPYALDMFLMNVVVPFSACLKSIELDNTAISGENLISTVLHARRETLVHLSIRGCKNVSLKYHIVPFLTMFALQCDIDVGSNSSSPGMKRLALKSLYAYRCRHHRRRPYLSSSLLRKDADAESTHELVNVCHKLGIWTDTAWCTTPAGRCARRAAYVKSRFPQGVAAPEVWVVFDRLWRSRNWIGPIDSTTNSTGICDAKLWETRETGCYGEALGTGDSNDWGEGKMTPAHLRRSHTHFVDGIRCDNCLDDITERCEHCSVLMHCVGCRKTLCASCAHERPYLHKCASSSFSSGNNQPAPDSFWWAPGATHSPGSMQDPVAFPVGTTPPQGTGGMDPPPILNFHWCCTKPDFSGGGGISIGSQNREVDQVRAVPLPRGQGWENLEYTVSGWSKTFPTYAYGDPSKPDYSLETGHLAMMKWLLGPPNRQVSPCPRNLCQGCYDSPQWKVHCRSCSKSLCIEHDLRGLRLRICGYRDLESEKQNIQHRLALHLAESLASGQGPPHDLPFRSQQPLDPMNMSIIDDSRQDILVERNIVSFLNHPSRSFVAPTPDPSCPPSSSSSTFFDSPTLEPLKWQGCQSFFCPPESDPFTGISDPRISIRDPRPRCPSNLLECNGCKVYVCVECIDAHPPCKCSYCSEHYMCPNCVADKRDTMCHRRQEEALRDRQWREQLQAIEASLLLKLADEAAEYVGEFFDRIEPRSPPPSRSMVPVDPGLADQIADPFREDHAAAEASFSHLEPDDMEWLTEDSQ
ncbi:uncharacterized protein N7515_006292 [Penicillium bovifimosum]|uniref:Uncharacterized protein n=1 Tax=Penicillium bovifimosum TaxID=126998 RepID=A0A9W9GUS5_9EURO|nr:uncharacterized protein N7515_006292 [Penicillium bovifimosum]KAJ5130253.1 hypothetical protein N7515_006292 [Penicillium bovifimosum]